MTEEITISDNQETTQAKKPAKKKSYASWLPANVIEIPDRFKDPNFVYRCVNWHWTGRVLQKQNEHWIVDKELTKRMEAAGYAMQSTLEYGKPQDGTLRFGELIVMKLPKEYAEARERYYKGMDPLQNKLQEENDDLYQKTGGRSYGDIKLKKGG